MGHPPPAFDSVPRLEAMTFEPLTAYGVDSMAGERIEVPELGVAVTFPEGWEVADGVIHLLVPARSFWDDVGFT